MIPLSGWISNRNLIILLVTFTVVSYFVIGDKILQAILDQDFLFLRIVRVALSHLKETLGATKLNLEHHGNFVTGRSYLSLSGCKINSNSGVLTGAGITHEVDFLALFKGVGDFIGRQAETSV